MKEICYQNNPKSLFRKYTGLVTWFANTQIGRDYLKQDNLPIPKEPISLFLPNGYHVQKDCGTYQATFTTRAVYAPKIYHALQVVDLLSQWIENFEEAQRILLGNLDLISWGRMPAAARSLHFITSPATFNPDANPESTSVDGWVRYYTGGSSQSWATVHDQTTGESANDSSASGFFTYTKGGASTNTFELILRTFLLFDTSSLTSSAIVTAATLSGYTEADKGDNATMNQSLVAVGSNPASNTSLSTSDYNKLLTTAFCTAVDFGSISLNAYLDLTLNSSGIAAVSLTGITKMGTTSENDRANSAPSTPIGEVDNYVRQTMADGSNKPKLVVTFDSVSTNYIKGRQRPRMDLSGVSLG